MYSNLSPYQMKETHLRERATSAIMLYRDSEPEKS